MDGDANKGEVAVSKLASSYCSDRSLSKRMSLKFVPGHVTSSKKRVIEEYVFLHKGHDHLSQQVVSYKANVRTEMDELTDCRLTYGIVLRTDHKHSGCSKPSAAFLNMITA